MPLDDPRSKRLRALAELEEGGLPGLDFEVSTPMGEARVTRQPLRPVDPENLDVAAPMSALGQASGGRPPPPVNPRDVELDDATALDEEAMRRRLFETATRQMIGGLTRTPTAVSLTQETHKKSDLLGQRAKARQEALREIELGNQSAKFDFDRKEAARKAALDEQRRREDLDERKIDNEARTRGQDLTAANTRALLGFKGRDEQREVDKISKGKDLPASEISALSELPVAEKQVDAAAEAFERLGMGGLGGKASAVATKAFDLQGTDAAEYNAAVSLAMQAAGKIVEGGKLAAGDEVKYRAMMPRPGDSPAVVKQKTEGMKSFLRDLASRRATAFRDARYNVPDSLMGRTPAAGQFVTLVDESGEELDVAPDKVDALLKKHPKMRRK